LNLDLHFFDVDLDVMKFTQIEQIKATKVKDKVNISRL
jgi:hypothetical protein